MAIPTMSFSSLICKANNYITHINQRHGGTDIIYGDVIREGSPKQGVTIKIVDSSGRWCGIAVTDKRGAFMAYVDKSKSSIFTLYCDDIYRKYNDQLRAYVVPEDNNTLLTKNK